MKPVFRLKKSVDNRHSRLRSQAGVTSVEKAILSDQQSFGPSISAEQDSALDCSSTYDELSTIFDPTIVASNQESLAILQELSSSRALRIKPSNVADEIQSLKSKPKWAQNDSSNCVFAGNPLNKLGKSFRGLSKNKLPTLPKQASNILQQQHAALQK